MSRMLQFQGGLVSNPVSDEQAVSQIIENLGLGMDLYVKEKKVEMLSDPLDYLSEHNSFLNYLGSTANHTYNSALNKIATAAVQPAVGAPLQGQALINARAEAKNMPWVKALAEKMAKQKLEADMIEIDVLYPIKDEAYKAQKSKNKRSLEEKAEQVVMGIQ